MNSSRVHEARCGFEVDLEVVDYIKYKEEHGEEAIAISDAKVLASETLYIYQLRSLIDVLARKTSFYATATNSYQADRSGG